MAQKLLLFCVSALTAVTFFSLGLLASHERTEARHFDAFASPHVDNPDAMPPPIHSDGEHIQKGETGAKEGLITGGENVEEYVMPGADHFPEAFSLFAEAWASTVVSKVGDLYATDKFTNLPASCSTAWDKFVKAQSLWINEVTHKFALLGSDFLAAVDKLISEKSQQAVETFEETRRAGIERMHEEEVAQHADAESKLRADYEAKSIAAGSRAREDTFKLSAAQRQDIKPEEIVILSASDYADRTNFRWQELLQAIENRDAYAEYHGYRHVFMNFTRYGAAKEHVAHPCWLKLPAIQEVFVKYPKTKWVWWLDMDAIIWDGSKKLEDLVLHPAVLERRVVEDLGVSDIDHRFYHGGKTPPKGEFNVEQAQFIFSQDLQTLNAGSFFVRNTPEAQAMIEFWGEPELIYNEQHEIKWGLKEQDAFVKLYLRHKAFRDAVAIVPQTLFNAYGPDDSSALRRANRGDLVVHFAGRSSHDEFYQIWDKVWATRTLPDGRYADPEFPYPADWQ